MILERGSIRLFFFGRRGRKSGANWVLSFNLGRRRVRQPPQLWTKSLWPQNCHPQPTPGAPQLSGHPILRSQFSRPQEATNYPLRSLKDAIANILFLPFCFSSTSLFISASSTSIKISLKISYSRKLVFQNFSVAIVTIRSF